MSFWALSTRESSSFDVYGIFSLEFCVCIARFYRNGVLSVLNRPVCRALCVDEILFFTIYSLRISVVFMFALLFTTSWRREFTLELG